MAKGLPQRDSLYWSALCQILSLPERPPSLRKKLAAEVTMPPNGASGVLATLERFGDSALLMIDGKPQFDYAISNQRHRITSDRPLAPGNHVVRFGVKYDGEGWGRALPGKLTLTAASWPRFFHEAVILIE